MNDKSESRKLKIFRICLFYYKELYALNITVSTLLKKKKKL